MPPTIHNKPFAWQNFVICLAALWVIGGSVVRAQFNAKNVLQMGRTALYYDDYVTAIAHFNNAIQARPQSAEAYYLRSAAKFSLDDFQGALSDCDIAVSLNPFRVEYYGLRGLCYIRVNDYESAIADYTRVLAEKPTDQTAAFNKTLCLLQLHRYTEATTAIDEMLRGAPRFTRGHMLKAQIFLEQGDTLSGLRVVDDVLRINPSEADAWAMKGRYACQREDYLLADSCLSRAIVLRPSDADNYLSRAIARNGLYKYNDALADYDKVIALIPTHFVAHYNRGLLRAMIGDDNRAIEDFTFVIKAEPDNVLAIYNRALLREQTGDYRGAVADYSLIIKAYPHFLYGYAARARCRRRIGDSRGALADETKVQRADLDMYFGKQPAKIKKVRRRSEHDLAQYQQLVEEDADTTRTFMGEYSGKVQNRKVSHTLLPMFTATLISIPTSTKGYHSVGYMAELDRVNRLPLRIGQLQLTAEEHVDLQDGSDGRHTLEVVATALDTATLCRTDLLLLRAVVHRQRYDLSSALADLNETAQDTTPNISAMMLRATILCEMQTAGVADETMPTGTTLYAQALGVMQQALLIAPDNAYLYYNRGCIYAAQGQTDKAIADFQQAITLDGGIAEAYYNQALLYIQSGQKTQAMPLLSTSGEMGLYKAYNLLKQISKPQ